MFKNINEAKVAADAAKRFRMLCEYTFNITEDDGEEAPQEGGEDTPDMGASEEGGSDMGGMSPDMSTPQGDEGGAPDMNVQQGDNMDMGGMSPDMNASQDGGEGAPGFNPSMEEGGDDMSQMGAEEMQPEDEVIDVDDLTQSQEETEEKVDDIHVTMEKGFDKLLNVVKKLDQMIDASTANMEQIKQEIEKRNPTPIEKLNMRAANDSYPFNVSPSDYWKEKEANSNYRIGGENEPDSEQYIITQGDIDDMTDFQRISKELDNSELSQNLMNIFGLR